jgi:hypothetical protein
MRLLEMGSRSYFSVWSTGNSLAIASRWFFSVWSTGNACARAFPPHSFFFPVDQPGKKSFRRKFFLVGLGPTYARAIPSRSFFSPVGQREKKSFRSKFLFLTSNGISTLLNLHLAIFIFSAWPTRKKRARAYFQQPHYCMRYLVNWWTLYYRS